MPLTQDEALARFEAGGHAIEARLCAEDPAQGFLPQSGRIVRWQAPEGVRVDHALASGCVVPPFYDSMLARVIATAPTRAAAVDRLADALDATVCLGVTTNRAFLARLVRDPEFAAGSADTAFVDRRYAGRRDADRPRHRRRSRHSPLRRSRCCRASRWRRSGPAGHRRIGSTRSCRSWSAE